MEELNKDLPALRLKLLTSSRVLIVEPKAPVGARDFLELDRAIYPWTATYGRLRAFVLVAPIATGLRGISGALQHIRFIGDYHPEVKRVAFVTNRRFLETVCLLVPQGCLADIRFFSTSQMKEALVWASHLEGLPARSRAKAEIFLPQVPGF
jgi:hypothetical protein